MPAVLPPNYTLHQGYPAVESYLHLRHTKEHPKPPTAQQAESALQGSWYGCYITYTAPAPPSTPANTTARPKAQETGEVVAMARLISDGTCTFHLTDLLIAADHKYKKLGNVIVAHLREKIREYVVGLGMGEKGKEGEGEAALRSTEVTMLVYAWPEEHEIYYAEGFVEAWPPSRGMVLDWRQVRDFDFDE
ncbi:hypothetical protein ASPACDRAFT_1851867 [Aspergillus aculeatus ATCC 16872]|uniref:Uncharacterized protein n=1 Tax=Aspergillus aculeatus (strain ATCC 16872 / CBS 172.66 / WB 5094) TaxID=690307 RepID=A0A1L9X914_ASPA1|nr:uncharacterized protein ASPACDRAFT_1851867 [Aspergillus aculeatus ATCC 16872]OJK04910.1 hypothetical protein ASPACDRAFT_1851867 [Aspergillus aculeatus ATCC 16872]